MVPPAKFDPRAFLETAPTRPGVYRMIGRDGEVLYVGKARNLKRRLASYFARSARPAKTHALVSQVHEVILTVTHTEGEALLLENNLIKAQKPRYNVLLRDDKSYPYIYVATEDPFPRLAFHRGTRRAPGRYFGPYPSAGAVRQTLSLLQKVFQIRQCEDSVFANRARPCLQYQIRRCTAPCVGLIDPAGYARDVRHAIMFLEGKSSEVIDELVARMEQAAEALEFERAAHYRDQISRLRRVYERQHISGEGGDLDVVAVAFRAGIACIQVFVIRDGRNLGNKTFFPRVPPQAQERDVLAAFLAQYYLERDPPAEILVSHPLGEAKLLEEVLSAQKGRRVAISGRVRGERARQLDLAQANAQEGLNVRLAGAADLLERFEALQDALALDEVPQRLECFDISHTLGEATVASCVVFDTGGAVKSDYRRFNIEGVRPGDDYAAMEQALRRRFTRLKRGEGKLPDVLLVDGGSGQTRRALGVLRELAVDGVQVVGIAKGVDRKAGREVLHLGDTGTVRRLRADSPALHLIQQVRDEAHRFAVTGHRQRRAKVRQTSVLEGIVGLGPKRRQHLLRQFGGLREIARAGVEDLAQVSGISADLAQRIYDAFHGQGR
jgi:excinuclease ABC subunit C